MNLNTYTDCYDSFKNFYLDKRLNGKTCQSVTILDVPCPRNKVVLRLGFGDGWFLNFLVKDYSCLTANLEHYQECFLNQKLLYCFTKHSQKFTLFDCPWTYEVRFVFANGKWISYTNPFNMPEDSCEALFVRTLK